MKSKLLKLLLITNTSLFIISLVLAFIVLFRPFYYIHINYLDIEKESGYSYSEIKEAYNDVINYTTLFKPFKTGKLKNSSRGKDHFHDVRILFIIDIIVLIITSIGLIIKRKRYNDFKVKKHSIGFWSGISLLSLFILILIFGFIVGFYKCFEIFHFIFFLGKENWLLNPYTDEIINIFPEQFFMNCAILVISLIIITSLSLIIKDIRNNKNMLK